MQIFYRHGEIEWSHHESGLVWSCSDAPFRCGLALALIEVFHLWALKTQKPLQPEA
jgi:hypothetical protein